MQNIAIFLLELSHATLSTRLVLGMFRLDPDYLCNVCVHIRVCSGYFVRLWFVKYADMKPYRCESCQYKAMNLNTPIDHFETDHPTNIMSILNLVQRGEV